jgi:23S rRNA (guanosine2251-2'-O)-methyltransferase
VGRNPVKEALATDGLIDKILFAKNLKGDGLQEIISLARQKQIPIQTVPVEKLNKLTNINHQGVIAYKGTVQYFNVQDVIDLALSKGKVPLFLLLDGVTDVRNIGAIARSAVAFGCDAIVVPDKGVAALGEDAMKSSAGALEKIHICRVNSLMKTIDELHLNGFSVYVADMQGTDATLIKATKPLAIVMGSEHSGVQSSVAKICDGNIAIPMPGGFESLNVSVAAGILLYEVSKLS